MKKKLFTIILVIFTLSTKAQVDLNYGLLRYFPFSGNAKDQSSYNDQGNIYGASLTTDRFGNSNSAYHFNGDRDFISFSINGLKNKSYSYSVWAKLNAYPNEWEGAKGLLTVGEQSLVVHYKFGWHMISYNTNSFPLGYSLGTMPNLNQWYHIVITRGDKYMYIYINGKLNAIVTVQHFPPAYSSNVSTIGSRDGSLQFFAGSLDEIRIYNRELNSEEVMVLYNENDIVLNTFYDKKESFTIAPNPSTDGKFQVSYAGGNFNMEDIFVYDNLGRKVALKKLNGLGNNEELDLSFLPKGIYYLNIKSGENNFSKKLVIE